MNNHISKNAVLKAPSGSIRGNQQWLEDLQAPDKRRDEALDELSNYLVRNLTRYLFVCRGDLSRHGEQELKQLARDFSQETLLKILDKLHTFQGRSSFLTWANRISIYLASGKLRRLHWKEVSLNRSIWDGKDEQFLDLVKSGLTIMAEAFVEEKYFSYLGWYRKVKSSFFASSIFDTRVIIRSSFPVIFPPTSWAISLRIRFNVLLQLKLF